MKRYDIEGGLNETLDIQESPNGYWVEWNDVQAETIPIPVIRVEDEGLYDPRDRWAVYVNNRRMGTHEHERNAKNHAEYIRRALNIPQ